MNPDFTHPPVKQIARSQKLMKSCRIILILFIFLLCSVAGPDVVNAEGLPVSKVISAGGYEALTAKIAGKGSVRLIVGVDTPFQPMADPQSAESIRQIDRIASAQDALLNELGTLIYDKAHKYSYIPYMVIEADEAVLSALLASSTVTTIHEDIARPATLDLSVPRIGAPQGWNLGYTGTGITLAVLDTGVDKTHPFLSGSVVSEACYSSTVSGNGAASLCPGGATGGLISSGSAMPYSGNCPAGKCDHGTHVAGIAAGNQNVAGSPGPGVAPNAGIIAIQVFSRFDNLAGCSPNCECSTSPCVKAYDSDIIRGLERIYALRATYSISSVNLSLGGGQYSDQTDCDTKQAATKTAIDNLKSVGIATIISSGNDGWCGSMGSPGCISSAVSVGATTDPDTVSSYSNSSTMVDLLAPGSDIISSIPGGSYARYWGTSMAAPHVTGAWALMKQAQPGRTVDQILSAFTGTGVSITDSKCGSVTKRRISVGKAVDFIKTFPHVETDAATSIGQTSAVISGRATANNSMYGAGITIEYGTTTSYGSTASATPSTVSGIGDTSVSAALTGLASNTLYHYRMKGSSRYGTSYSADRTFITSGTCGSIQSGGLEGYPPLPGWTDMSTHCGTPLCNVFDNPVDCTPHSGYGAAMFGCFILPEIGSLTQDIVIPKGASQNLQFYLSNNQRSLNDVDSFNVLIDGWPILTIFEGDQSFYSSDQTAYTLASLDLSPYADGGTHSLSLYSAVSGASFFLVDDISMSCSKGTLPSITTGEVIPVSGDEVYLTGTVNAYGSVTAVTFDYGTTDTYEFIKNADPGAVGINGDYPVSAQLLLVSPGTTYHYRLRGQNSNGIAYGRDMTFTTYCASPEARIGALSFPDIQTAVSSAVNGTEVKVSNAAFTENLTTLLGSGTVTLKGGYDCAFGSTVGHTTIKGKITIQGSKNIIADNIIVQ